MADGTGLFDEPPRVEAAPVETGTAAERRRARQLAAILAGQHPLSVALRVPIPLHPDAVRDDDRTTAGRVRCGGCALRRRLHGGNRSYPKCTAGRREHVASGLRWAEHPRASHGDGTDVAAWWPACTDYEPAPVER